MAADLEKAPVTELLVRMDCNGCVQRIKKAIQSIDGVDNIYVDFPQQKLTVVGRAEPETLVKAIKKRKKIATICSHTEPSATEPQTEALPAEPAPPAEPPKEDPPPQENPTPEEPKPSPEAEGPTKPSEAKDMEEVHMVHDYPHNYPIMAHEIRHEAPYYVTHSYDTYRPSPYGTEYGYLRETPRDVQYSSIEAYSDGYHQNQGSEQYHHNHGGTENQMNSMFSDENPNACTIV